MQVSDRRLDECKSYHFSLFFFYSYEYSEDANGYLGLLFVLELLNVRIAF